MTDRIRLILRNAAGIIILAAIGIAPYNGALKVAAYEFLSWCLLAGAGLGIIDRLLAFICSGKRTISSFSLVAILLTIWGWFLVFWNAPFKHSFAVTQLISRNQDQWAASIAIHEPFQAMLFFTGLLGTGVVVRRLARSRVWHIAFIGAMFLSGLLAIGSGIIDEIWRGGETFYPAKSIFVSYAPSYITFGPFFHHSIASAFLTFVTGLCQVLAGFILLRVSQGPETWKFRLLGIGMLAIAPVLIATQFLTISKIGPFLALFGLSLQGGFLVIFGIRSRQPFARYFSIRRCLVAILLLLAVGISVRLAITSEKTSIVANRWDQYLFRPDARGEIPVESFPDSDRRHGWGSAFVQAKENFFVGQAPGSWAWRFVEEAHYPALRQNYLWQQFAHNDYIQTLFEWGLPGLAGWLFLGIGGIYRGLRIGLRAIVQGDVAAGWILFGSSLTLIPLYLHSGIDFPLQVPVIQLFAVILLGTMWNASKS